MNQNKGTVFVAAFQRFPSDFKCGSRLKEPPGLLRGKEGALTSVSMINSRLREWIFVRVSSKLNTGGYKERR